MSRLHRFLMVLFLGLVLITGTAGSAHAVDLSPPPELPSLHATFEPICIGLDKDVPALRASMWNNTNGPRLFEVHRNGTKLFTTLLSAGEHKSHILNLSVMEGSHHSFEIVVLNTTKAWHAGPVHCGPAVIEVLVNGGKPATVCAGQVLLEIINSGGEAADVQVSLDGVQVDAMHLWPKELIPSTVSASAGQVVRVHHEGQVVFARTVSQCQPSRAERPRDLVSQRSDGANAIRPPSPGPSKRVNP